ncbi:hypothetical protein V1508DRAFT_424280, partial [Lipomyces doorenjongii]|uniref:uncharacterized protein n=1 Tax=Lipomyces doorenjongii TaxID=383834 RepID=UPI0034D005D5
MVTRKGGQRRIRSKTARAMATWSHYKFQQRLLDKAREYKSCKVVWSLKNTPVRHAENSTTLGVVKCDRDVNGARNTL